MFGKKKIDLDAPKVPVYTVHMLPRKYEPMQTILIKQSFHDQIIDEMAIEGAKIGADAVIGLAFHFLGTVSDSFVSASGTAIKYID